MTKIVDVEQLTRDILTRKRLSNRAQTLLQHTLRRSICSN